MSLLIRAGRVPVCLRRARLRREVDGVRRLLGLQRFDLGLVCADNKRIQALNLRYRGHGAPTDILAFPFYPELRAGEMPQPQHPDEWNLGDIFLGVEYIHRQSQEDGLDLHNLLTVTVVHGICHLLGYRHDSLAEHEQMYRREQHILQMLNRQTGAHLQPLMRKMG
ncbi:endoribonuclease YbeY [Callorhinchus milii]|uniref:YbeY metalloendoribonuclease n=1 Tax=Callorhinchus milii TaxID=7868 RepID=K4FSQ4_CALMI|nr:endoribonuclease YbeY [Callorhinchus milii]AFK10730.1 rRNA maturation factor-like protein [Callorhinchus milii]|eukprot:gi/632980941/ref/XP_007907317.1/ PREDICTED: putative ribonuclease isoform X1 [Callorhinchus milii]